MCDNVRRTVYAQTMCMAHAWYVWFSLEGCVSTARTKKFQLEAWQASSNPQFQQVTKREHVNAGPSTSGMTIAGFMANIQPYFCILVKW